MTTLLLIEDDKFNCDLLSSRLQHKGYTVETAMDGAEGVAMARLIKPDLIVMNMSLPMIDGWEATQHIKASATTKAIPIIALIAPAAVGDRDRSLTVGCSDYATKPVDFPHLLSKITALLPTHILAPR